MGNWKDEYLIGIIGDLYWKNIQMINEADKLCVWGVDNE